MVSIRAHFDGKVFVPDEPVNVPPNSNVRLLLVEDSDGDRPLMELIDATAPLAPDPTWPTDAAAEHDHYLYGSGASQKGERKTAEQAQFHDSRDLLLG